MDFFWVEFLNSRVYLFIGFLLCFSYGGKCVIWIILFVFYYKVVLYYYYFYFFEMEIKFKRLFVESYKFR